MRTFLTIHSSSTDHYTGLSPGTSFMHLLTALTGCNLFRQLVPENGGNRNIGLLVVVAY